MVDVNKSEASMSDPLRALWRRGQVDSSSDAAMGALFAENDQAADAALDEVAESPRMASMVQVVSGLRADAEMLSRDVKQLRQPRPARPGTAAERWPWAVAASVALMAWWALPGHSPAPADMAVVAPTPATPASEVLPADAGRILTASFEASAEANTDSNAQFSAGFDS